MFHLLNIHSQETHENLGKTLTEMLLMVLFSLLTQHAEEEEEEMWSFKAVSSLFPLKYGKFKHHPSHSQ